MLPHSSSRVSAVDKDHLESDRDMERAAAYSIVTIMQKVKTEN